MLTYEPMQWSNMKRYDFYVPLLNMIIETHGGQHYEDGFQFAGGNTLDEEISNDKYKYELAMENGIGNYIVIDCRYSKFDYIKNNILNSELVNFFDFSKVDWKVVQLKLNKTLIETVLIEWNEDWKSSKDIANNLNLTIKKTIELLEKAAELGLCNYDRRVDLYFKEKTILKLDDQLRVIERYLNKEEALSMNSVTKIDTSVNSIKRNGGYYWCKEIDYEKFKEKVINNKIELKRNKELRIRSIVQIDLKGNVVRLWEKGIKEVLEVNPDFSASPLGNSLSRTQSTYKNYIWLYKEFYHSKEGVSYVNSITSNNKAGSKKKVVLQIDCVNSEVINRYESGVEAVKQNDLCESSFRKCIDGVRNTTKGFIWMIESEYETTSGQIRLNKIIKKLNRG